VGLRDAQSLGRFRLGELLFLNVKAKIAYQVGAHPKYSGLSRIETEIRKDIAAGFNSFLFHI
jgi:hypothetical protein